MPSPATPMASTADAPLRKELLKSFPSHMLPADHPSLPLLISILRIYSPQLSAEDLYYKTEAFLLQEKSQTINEELVEHLKISIQREWESKAMSTLVQSKTLATPTPKPRSGLGSLCVSL
jgi:hypothetical protein